MRGFSRFVRAARKKAHKTVQRVANEAGLDYWQYANMEQPGRRKTLPKPDELARLAASLGVTLAELVEAAGYRLEGCDGNE